MRRWLRLVHIGGLISALAGCPDNRARVGHGQAALGAWSKNPDAVRLSPGADVAFRDAEVLARASWGAGPDQLGKVDEASRPGPMSLTVTPDNTVYVLDQVNARVVPFTAEGIRRPPIAIGADTAEDLLVSGERLWVLIYEPGPSPGYRLAEHALDGTRLQQVPLSREIQLVTGLFATGPPSAPDLWVEQEHDAQVLVVARGVGLPPGVQVTRVRGRAQAAAPRLRVVARPWDDAGFRVTQIYPGNYTSEVLALRTPLPPIAVENWTVTERGVAMVVTIGAQSAASEGTWRELRRIALLPRGPGKVVSVELAPEYATDTFRPTAFGPDAVYQLHPTEQGVRLLRWWAGVEASPRGTTGGDR